MSVDGKPPPEFTQLLDRYTVVIEQYQMEQRYSGELSAQNTQLKKAVRDANKFFTIALNELADLHDSQCPCLQSSAKPCNCKAGLWRELAATWIRKYGK